jgi:hypothetical protein
MKNLKNNKKDITAIRNWFNKNGKMDFELNPNLPKEKHGKFITYSCKEIDNLFEKFLIGW